ncbi:hypothetical protein EJ04DRAFT_563135 [Polyplosphaeria fusca]|uniref:Uncharacterized protein n=1 Tax=Polyplosphaeria fusca TaxID=682080 RepID=A0A9P4QZ98_9PLEO|nr:hypothetical protein EJ04DRAFT_563135 [Polyplosphaeria fusca]
MSGTLSGAARLCSDLPPQNITTCLSELLENSGGIRTVNEVWIRTFGIHVVALASYGHLLSLQGHTKSSLGWSSWALFFFCLFPEIAIAQILLRTLASFRGVLRHKRNLSLRFFAASCLGMRVKRLESGMIFEGRYLLADFEPSEVELIPRSFDLLWLGRFALLLALLAQYIGSAFLWFKLVFFLRDRSYWHWHIDYRNVQVVLGALLATLNSMGILLVGGEWTLSPKADFEDHDDMKTSSVFTSQEDAKLSDSPISQDEHSETWSNCLIRITNSSVFKELRRFDSVFRHFLDRQFPQTIQTDFECGLILHRILSYIVVVFTFHRFPGGCPPIFELLNRDSTSRNYSEMCPDRIDMFDPLTFALIPKLRESLRVGPWLLIPTVLFSVALARILLHWVLTGGLLLRQWSSGSIPGWARDSVEWIFSGRSLLSFPTLLLVAALCPFWIDGLIEQRGWAREAEISLTNQSIAPIDRIAIGIFMWKDPWQDSLYII